MNSVMLQLGRYQFSMATARYQELTRVTRYRWAKMERAYRGATRQFTGPDESTISLRGSIFPGYKGGLYQIDDMLLEADQGKAHMLVDSYGYIHGQFVILEVEETHKHLWPDGEPRQIEFVMHLASDGDTQRAKRAMRPDDIRQFADSVRSLF